MDSDEYSTTDELQETSEESGNVAIALLSKYHESNNQMDEKYTNMPGKPTYADTTKCKKT